MSDQGPFGQPPVPPAPPSAPPTPPAQWGQPPAAVQPPARKRKVWLIVVIALVILVCVPALCLGTFAVSAMREKAQVNEAVALAEQHYDAATDSLEAASTAMESFGTDGGTDSADDAESKIRASRDEIAAARAAIEALDDSDGKKNYLASLDSATSALDGVEGLIGTLRVLSQLSDQIADGTKAIKSADGLLDAAIDAGNDGKYSTMKSKASSASSRYATALAIFNAAHKLEPAAGLDTVVSYVKLRKQQADLAVRMASDGKAGRISAYNKQVATQRSLDKKAEKTGEPEIVKDPEWFQTRVAEQQAYFEAAGQEADALRTEALKQLGYTAE